MCNHQIPQKLLLWSYFSLTCFGPTSILKGHNITQQLVAALCIVKRKGDVAVYVIRAHRGVCVYLHIYIYIYVKLGSFVPSALNGGR
jgi:hypothetical protein